MVELTFKLIQDTINDMAAKKERQNVVQLDQDTSAHFLIVSNKKSQRLDIIISKVNKEVSHC